VTAVAPRGSPAGNKLFTPESHTAITAVTGFYADFGFIDKHSLL
jgi:hypothetical protein